MVTILPMAMTNAPAPRDAAEKRLLEYADREQRALDGWHALGATPKSTTLHTERITLARDAAAEIAALRARVEAAEELRATTLREAARAVCKGCAAGRELRREVVELRNGCTVPNYQHYLPTGRWDAPCAAGEIHALLAAARATPAQDTPTTEG